MNIRQMRFGLQMIMKHDGGEMGFRWSGEVVSVVGAAVENERTWIQVRWLRCSEFSLMDSNGQSRTLIVWKCPPAPGNDA